MSKRLWISNPMGHEWALNDHGSVDAMAMCSGDHNGPRCVRCGYTFCEHCQDMPSHRCPKEHDAIKDDKDVARQIASVFGRACKEPSNDPGLDPALDSAAEIIARIRAEAKAEALREAAERAVDWVDNNRNSMGDWTRGEFSGLRAAILSDQAPEAGKVEGSRENCVSIYAEIEAERIRQDAKWGEQNHPIREEHASAIEYFKEEANAFRMICDLKAREGRLTWYDILIEEMFEVFAEDTSNGQRAELVQMVAVGIAMIECIDRRAGIQRRIQEGK